MNTASNQQATSLQMFYNEDANVSIRTEASSVRAAFAGMGGTGIISNHKIRSI